ncbi:MAG: alpha/beta hydrolase [Chloroflexi bacterium]|nr:alpha/beta hydrolase [Chloroflexota bacterium]
METAIHDVETRDGGRLAFRTFGDTGETVVLLPSLGRSGSDFENLGSALVEAGFRAVAVDQRGVDDSTGPVDSITLHVLAADVASLIESLDCEPAHVVGHAFGNRVARCLATDRQELVRSVSLLAAGGMVEPSAEIREALRRCFQLELPDAERLEAIQAAFFAPENEAAVWRDGWWPGGAAIQGKANLATPLEDWWEAGSAPLLVVQGLDDATAPVANGYALKEQLGDRVELVDIADAGHALLPEQPEEIAEAVLGFLARH